MILVKPVFSTILLKSKERLANLLYLCDATAVGISDKFGVLVADDVCGLMRGELALHRPVGIMSSRSTEPFTKIAPTVIAGFKHNPNDGVIAAVMSFRPRENAPSRFERA